MTSSHLIAQKFTFGAKHVRPKTFVGIIGVPGAQFDLGRGGGCNDLPEKI